MAASKDRYSNRIPTVTAATRQFTVQILQLQFSLNYSRARKHKSYKFDLGLMALPNIRKGELLLQPRPGRRPAVCTLWASNSELSLRIPSGVVRRVWI